MASETFFEEAAREFIRLSAGNWHKPLHKRVSGLSAGETGMLFYLSGKEGGVTAGQISRDLQIGSGGVANVLNILEKKGMISRTMSLTDRRSVIVSISGEGMKETARIKKEVTATIQAFLEDLGEEDTKQLLRIYRRALEIGEGFAARHPEIG